MTLFYVVEATINRKEKYLMAFEKEQEARQRYSEYSAQDHITYDGQRRPLTRPVQAWTVDAETDREARDLVGNGKGTPHRFA